MRARRTPSSNSLMLPFMAEKKSVIGPTGIIDAVEIDRRARAGGANPDRSWPGERVETEDGSHVAGAQPCDKLLKPRSGHCAARRAARVVIDDLDIPKSTSSGLIDKLVLAPLALEVDLHLDLGGLADVDDGLSLQERRGKDLTVHHRPLLDSGRFHQQARARRFAPER